METFCTREHFALEPLSSFDSNVFWFGLLLWRSKKSALQTMERTRLNSTILPVKYELQQSEEAEKSKGKSRENFCENCFERLKLKNMK